MGIGAATTYFIYASTQKNQKAKVDSIAMLDDEDSPKKTKVEEQKLQKPQQLQKSETGKTAEPKAEVKQNTTTRPAPADKQSDVTVKQPPAKEQPETSEQLAKSKKVSAETPKENKKQEPAPEKTKIKKAEAPKEEKKSFFQKAKETILGAGEPEPTDYQAVFKPLLSKKYSEQDIKTFNKAYTMLRKRRYTKAKPIIKSIKDPIMKKCLQWYLYKSTPNDLSFTKLEKYWTKNPDWPSLDNLKYAAEAKLISASNKRVRKYLDKYEPVSSAGLLAQVRLLTADGKKEEAQKIIRKIWREERLSREIDKIIIKNHKKLITNEDRHHRAQRYLYEKGRKSVASALYVARPLDKATKKLLDIQILGVRRSRATTKKILALKKEDKLAPNMIYTRVKYLRKKKKYAEAWKLLLQAPADPVKLASPKKWWREKRNLILAAMDKKKYQIAYDIAKNHGQNTVNEINDGEFLAGWIALRYLKKPKEAHTHFTNLSKTADGPRSRSKSWYWLGRTSLELRDEAKATEYFKKGADYFNTFYGQLSKQSLNPDDQQIKIPDPHTPTIADMRRFRKRDALKVVVLAHQAKQNVLAARFLAALRYAIKEPGELTLLAEFIKKLDHNQQLVRLGKLAMFKGFDHAKYAYPLHAMPKIVPLRGAPEKAFPLAIARQESEFNTKIQSHVGARGLMQVMPATARLIARQYKLKYSKSKLTEDPSYNVRLGTAYIADRLRDFGGSYIKTIAGYNAGPGRVMQWTRRFGNPSSKDIDPIDWIERIPFTETRNYVKKVLANMQVYRSLLGNEQNALQLRQDLYRGRKDAHKARRPLVASN